MRYGMLNDVTRCVGCRSCQVACKQWNDREAEVTVLADSFENPPDFSEHTWKRVRFVEREKDGETVWNFIACQCNHCGKAGCMAVCPADAIKRSREGAVYVDEKLCTGCRYCHQACPFHIPRPDWNKNVTSKCTLCADRIANGSPPACAKACPAGAIVAGNWNDVLSVARKRAAILSRKGSTGFSLYGDDILGGLGTIYLLPDAPEVFGFPIRPEIPRAAGLSDIPGNSFGSPLASLFLAAVAYLRLRKRREP